MAKLFLLTYCPKYPPRLHDSFKSNVSRNCQVILFLFFLIGIHSMQVSTATMTHGVTTKEAQKKLQNTENLFRKNLQLKDVF